MDKEYDTAEWAFQADARLKDYHKNMDHAMFMRWVEKQLLPAFEKRYPGKIMNLFLDNAPYHTAGPADSLKPWSMTKGACEKELRAMHDDDSLSDDARMEIGVIRTARVDGVGNPKSFMMESWGRAGNSGGPYSGEVQTHLEAMLRKHSPKRLMTSLEILFAEKKWNLIFTPPYMPKFQPIERCWGYCKNGVAQEYAKKRSLAATHAQLLDMFYGGTGKKIGVKMGVSWKGIDGEMSSAWIRKCEEDMDKWIKKFGVKCSGTVKTLQWDKEKAYSDGLHHEDVAALDDEEVEDEGV
jgi:hypothetical protein